MITLFEKFNYYLLSSDNKETVYRFDTGNYQYKVNFYKKDNQPEYYYVGFSSKGKDDYFFSVDNITNENIPYEILRTVNDIIYTFYNDKVKELKDFINKLKINKSYSDFIKGFIFSLRTGDNKKSKQRLMLYQKMLDKDWNIVEFDDKFFYLIPKNIE